MYNFDEKLSEGQEYERQIDALFAPGFAIEEATRD